MPGCGGQIMWSEDVKEAHVFGEELIIQQLYDINFVHNKLMKTSRSTQGNQMDALKVSSDAVFLLQGIKSSYLRICSPLL